MAHITCKNAETITISFPYDPDLVAAVKTIPGRRYDGSAKAWTAPAAPSAELDAFIEKAGVEISDDLAIKLGKLQAPNATFSPVAGTSSESLYAHQQELVARVQAGARRILLADEPGLGKTAQAIISAAAAGSRRLVIVAPTVVTTSWEREVERWWAGRSVQILKGRKPVAIEAGTDVVIIGYPVLDAWAGTLQAWRPDALVLDEAHFIKGGSKVKRSAAAVELAHAIPATGLVMLLTGTPIPNRPIELAPQLDALGWLDGFGGFWSFAKRYAEARQARYGWDMTGAANLEELRERLTVLGLVRRRKTDVLDLPSRQIVDLPAELSGAKDLRAAQKALVDALIAAVKEAAEKSDKPVSWELIKRVCAVELAKGGSPAFTELARVRRELGLAKVGLITEQAQSILDAGEQVVIMVHHREVAEQVASALDVSAMHGGTGGDERSAMVDAFQAGTTRALVATMGAAGVGITLTAASQVVLGELPWNPAAQDQAIDRVHRIGQEQPVTAWRVLANDPMDLRMAEVIAQKAAVAAEAIDGEVTEAGETAGISQIVAEMVAKKLKIKAS